MPVSAASQGRTASCQRLPTSVRPTNYKLSLFDIVNGGPWTYQGHVQIDLDITSVTNRIVLNAQELKILGADLISTSEDDKTVVIQPIDIACDPTTQRCAFQFDDSLPQSPQHRSVLKVSFQGVVNDQLVGFYRSPYSPQRQSSVGDVQDESEACKFMLSTQFQPTYARRAFPCFDEPDLKATFDLDIEVPTEVLALSNMHVRREQAGRKPGYKVVQFQRTPIMSTYLLAWAVGEFEYIEQIATRPDAESYSVRLYTTEGLASHGKFGLQMAIKALDHFSRMFRVEYPLSKLDLLAVHGMADDAMENWGLLTFQTTALLFDEKTSDPRYLVHVAYIVAHELAHQWFGNLVTMEWWNELWLNEGFATWAGWHVVDLCYPDWNVWAQFVGSSMQKAFHLDSLRASHPVEVETFDALAVDSMFDAISYLKGSSLIRMLASYVGVDAFLQGVSTYLREFAYSNTTAEHLWHALSAVSDLEIGVAMKPWITKVGFPVITIEEAERHQLEIQQKRYLWESFATLEEDTTLWWIPIRVQSRTVTENEIIKLPPFQKKKMFYDNDESKSQFLNWQQSGFYRVDFTPRALERVQVQLSSLSALEQIGLLGDIAASAATSQGALTTVDLLMFMENFSSQIDFHVWDTLISHLNTVKSIFSCDEQVLDGLNKFILDLTFDVGGKSGWRLDASSSPSGLPAQLRGILISAIGLAGHEVVATEALQRFGKSLDGDTTSIEPALRQAIFNVAVKQGGVQIFKIMQREYRRTTIIDGRETILRALGQVQTKELATEYLSFAFNGEVEAQDLTYVIDGLASNDRIEVRETMWDFIKEHWGIIEERYAGSLGTFEPLLRRSLETLASETVRDDVRVFFRNKNTTGYAVGLTVGLEEIAWRARYLKRDLGVVRDWLQLRAVARDGD